MTIFRLALALLTGLALSGCGAAYYLSAAQGQAELLRARQPLEQVLKDDSTADTLRQKLLVVDGALVFAHVSLGLPRNGSYRSYADLKRPYVVWAVFAAPEFSLAPRQWCYPFAGCVAYRGWFSEARAREFAAGLAERDEDTYVAGVPAYSSLGWFADPVLNTMLGQGDAAVAGIIFHELAHQLLYVPGDTRFNEGFASFVEEEGTRRWLASRGEIKAACELDAGLRRRGELLALVAGLRAELAAIYASALPAADKRHARTQAFRAAQGRYQDLRATWDNPPYFDGWFAAGLNNARLAALASYEDYVPAFRYLLRTQGDDLQRFYARSAALAALPPGERDAELADLLAAGNRSGLAGPPPVACPGAPGPGP